MIIFPQNRERLIRLPDNQEVVIGFRKSPYVRDIQDTLQERQLCMALHSGKFYELGLYKGDERCKQILQEIAKCLSIGLSVYPMPEE